MKKPKIFISHSTEDKRYAAAIVDLFRALGLNQNHIFCSSYAGFGVQNSEDIVDYLQEQYVSYDLFLVFLHSENYYNSIISQNEMGAAWALKKNYISFTVPGFLIENMKGVIGKDKLAIKLDGDIEDIKDRLNELRDTITKMFSLEGLRDSVWEKCRNEFVSKVNQIYVELDSNKDNSSTIKIESTNILENVDNDTLIQLALKRGLTVTRMHDKPGDSVNSEIIRTVIFGNYPQSHVSIENPIKLQDKGDDIFLNSITGEHYLKLSKSNATSAARNLNFSDGTEVGKVQRRVSYFKFEPIEWFVLKNDGYSSILLSKKILDWSHFLEPRFVKVQGNMYLTTYGNYEDGARANNWKFSSLRSWLNTSFLNCAFDGNQRRAIVSEYIDNSATSGCIEEASEIQKYCCANTEDKVFILSYADVINPDYGFSVNPSEKDTFRIAEVTDYAIARGVNPTTDDNRLVGWWWLRSPADYRKYYMLQYPDAYQELLDDDDKRKKAKRCVQLRVCDVMSDGHVCSRGSIVDGHTFIEEIEGDCDGTANGVRIAIRVKNSYWNN